MAVPDRSGAFTPCGLDAMVVFDGSASMAVTNVDVSGRPRIADARLALHRALPQIAPFRKIGLILYGPNGTPGDGPGAKPADSIGCRSIDLRLRPTAQAADRIVAEIDQLAPAGSTPLTAAVAKAAEVLDFKRAPGAVVLVTDGKETCGGNPCQLAATFAAKAADLTVHVIGFKVRFDYFDWESGAGGDHQDAPVVARCLADQTGGTYTSTETVDELVEALNATLGCAVIGRRMGDFTHLSAFG